MENTVPNPHFPGGDNAIRMSQRPRNLENRGHPAVKCYRNALYVVLFSNTAFMNQVHKAHPPGCHESTGTCMVCPFRDLATRFAAPDDQRLRDTTFDADVDKFWRNATRADWPFELQNDPVEYMDNVFGFFQRRKANWLKDLVFPTPKKLRACQECSHITYDEAPFPNIAVSMPCEDSFQVKLETQIAAKYPENATEAEWCNQCGRRTMHNYTEPIQRVPLILPIQITPTYKNDHDTMYKGTLDRLDPFLAFSSYPDPKSHPEKLKYTFYRLHGVILHTGGPRSDHYISAVNYRGQGWLLFNDQDSEDPSLPLRMQHRSAPSRPITLKGVEEMQKNDWRVFVLLYERLFGLDGQVQAGTGGTNGEDTNGHDTAGEDSDTDGADTNEQVATNGDATNGDAANEEATIYQDTPYFLTNEDFATVASLVAADGPFATNGDSPIIGDTGPVWDDPAYWNTATTEEAPTSGVAETNGAATNGEDAATFKALSDFLTTVGGTPNRGRKRTNSASYGPQLAKRRITENE